MSDNEKSRSLGEWKEIEPAVYERKGYSQAQKERLTQRPDHLIESAIRASVKAHEKNNRR